jgi:cytochrome c peroxidase
MKRNISIAISCIALLLTVLNACKPDPDMNAVKAEPFEFKIPENWPVPAYQFQNNKLTIEGFELGKRLFYDARLSRNNEISCGSCHQQSAAFAHSDHRISHGVEDRQGNRNSPVLYNLNWHTSFFWDGGVNHLESQPINPIQNPLEMDETMPNIIPKLEADSKYKQMFAAAFGDEMINSQRIFKALSQFMGMMVSSNSKYDKYMRKEAGGDMTGSELNGLNIFRAKCETCHKEPLFSDFSLRNNGLAKTIINDSGKAHITKDPADLYKFKVASLRNLATSMPYMHDGRFETLEQVLTHYTSGIVQSPTLDPELQNGIQLTAQEKTDLLAFLNTLNDSQFLTDSKFAEVK